MAQTTSVSPAGPDGSGHRIHGNWPVFLCWVAVALDGFDLVVLGAVIPTLERTRALGFTNESLTWAATIGLVGVGIGAIGVGPTTDRYGRRKTLILSIAWFSVLTMALAWAPNVGAFTTLRFLAGIGLGACLPTALAFISEYAVIGRRGTAMTRMMTGYHVGAVLTALLALWTIGSWGWRPMFVAGGVAGLATLPFMLAKLPESDAYLAAASQADKAPLSTVVTGRYLRASIGLWVASFCGLLLVYGLNTWLPKIMSSAGYSIDASIGLLLTLNLGAVAGLIVVGDLADRHGNKPLVLLWFSCAAVLLALLSIKMQVTLVVYASVFLAGIFVFGAQNVVYTFVSHLYPPEIRGTALGMAAGVGRGGAIVGPFLGGALVTAGIAYPWGFYAFSAAAVVAVIALAFVPSHLKPSPRVTVAPDPAVSSPAARSQAPVTAVQRTEGAPSWPTAI